VRRSVVNVKRLANALYEFGVELDAQSQGQMASKDRGVIFIGHKPNRADFLNFLDGVDFDSALSRRVSGVLASFEAPQLSLDDYVVAKKASGRPKDLADLALLEATIKLPPSE
jgi:hypothetical protein